MKSGGTITKVGVIDLKNTSRHHGKDVKSVHHVPEHLSTMSPDRTQVRREGQRWIGNMALTAEMQHNLAT